MSGGDVAGMILIIIVIGVPLIVAFTSGYFDGRYTEKEKWQKDTIDLGLAQYNTKTGEWEWSEK